MHEEWRVIPGYAGYYEASSEGRVRSLDRIVQTRHGKTWNLKGKVLKATVNKQTGYPSIGLSLEGKVTTFLVHRLIASVFIDCPSEGLEVNHKNGIKLDSRAANLEWISRDDNICHAISSGLIDTVGASNGMAILTARQVVAVKEMAVAWLCPSEIAKCMGISKSHVGSIISGSSWRHIKLTGSWKECIKHADGVIEINERTVLIDARERA